MLLKLLKYDFRAMWKHFSLIWGAALVLGLVNRLTHSLSFMFRAGDYSGNIRGFTNNVLMIVFVVMFVISIQFVLRRFSKGLLGSEGYLMHTLPVRSWQLVLSKLICAIAACVGSTVVAFLAMLLMYTTDFWELFDIHLWNDIIRALARSPETVGIVLGCCLLLLSLFVELISIVYLSISIGHLFSRHRKVVGIASFIGLYILLGNFFARLFSWDLMELLLKEIDSSVCHSMLAASVTMLIPAAVFLAAVCWILDHKLNLE